MAGSDCKFDTKMTIADFIEQKTRDLLVSNMGDFDDPAWVQAAELFVEIVVPSDFFYSDNLMTLGFDIVKVAEKHNCRVAFRTNSSLEGKIIDYSETIDSIKKWIIRNKDLI